MRTISDTITRLAALRAASAHNGAMAGFGGAAGAQPGRLTPLTGFGTNPGGLHGYTYVPPALEKNAALVVVLHGCTQTAAGYDLGSGWSQMADRHGFVLLFPEQQRRNNPNVCLNWFSPDDNRRDAGEALSIRQMIATVTASHAIDPARVFVTGLSAGGAMTSVLLASYPEVFAGGAIIAGLPFGCANSVPQAFDRMRGHGLPRASELAALVRGASAHSGRWPTLSIWHGTADATVSHDNARAIIEQWRPLHGVSAAPSRTETVGGHARRVWTDAQGREALEEYVIEGMGHGTPIDTRGPDGCGASGPYMLDVGISSTREICRFWGLAEPMRGARPSPAQDIARAPAFAQATPPPRSAPHTARPHPAAAGGVRKVIEDALRAAGLMR